MTECIIACRSVTYAQKYAKLLKKHNYTAYLTRLPSHLSGSGCGHAVRVPYYQLDSVLEFLENSGAGRLRVYERDEYGEYKERLT